MDGVKNTRDDTPICITHSFPYKEVNAVFGHWDVSPEELDFIHNFLSSAEFEVKK